MIDLNIFTYCHYFEFYVIAFITKLLIIIHVVQISNITNLIEIVPRAAKSCTYFLKN